MLNLHVSCNDDNTMNITSNHLDIMPFPEDQEQQTDPGEELSKRGEYFGHPVGKSEPTFHPRLLPINSQSPPFQRRPKRVTRFDLQDPERAGTESQVYCQKGVCCLCHPRLVSHPL
jgi:hypothetical protein